MITGKKKNHYETLGVSKDATQAEIKTKFRKLSMETHPDVAGGDAERFKLVADAASVLCNPKQREAYDFKLQALTRSPIRTNAREHFFHPQRPTTPVQVFVSTLFRPRNLIAGFVGVYGTIYLYNKLVGEDNPRTVTNQNPMVQAWKNPETGRWEQPAPWDPLYRQLKPKLEYVPRDQVKSRFR